MKQYYWLFTTIFLISTSLQAQKIFKVDIAQSSPIQINPGAATMVCAGSELMLGGSPTASGGNGQLFYYWQPADKLDNPTSPNPIAYIDTPVMFTLTVFDENGCSRQDYIKIDTDQCTGIQESVYDVEFSVFPNPASEKIFIKISGTVRSGEKNLKIFNSYGQLVRQATIEENYSGDSYELAIRDLLPGLYFIQVSQGDYSKVQKIQIY